MRTTARSRVNAAPDRPATAMRRPQFGSPPCTAVLTSGELAIARAVRRASSSDAAPRDANRDRLGRAFAAANDADRERFARRLQAADEERPVALGQLDAARAVGEREHAVVGRTFAVDGDRVERLVDRGLERTLQQCLAQPRRRS